MQDLTKFAGSVGEVAEKMRLIDINYYPEVIIKKSCQVVCNYCAIYICLDNLFEYVFSADTSSNVYYKCWSCLLDGLENYL